MTATEIQIPSTRRVLATAFGWGVTVLLLSIGAQWLVYDVLLDDPGGMRVISPIIAAIATAVLAFRLQIRNRQQQLAQQRRFQIIGEMNHHIRNAVQVISYQAYACDAEVHGRMRDAISRIDWALRDVLPQINETEPQMVDESASSAHRNQTA